MKVNIVEDSTNTEDEKEYLSFVKRINESLKDVNYELILNNNESLFKVEESMQNDESDIYVKLAKRLGGGRGVYYTDFTSKKILQKAEGFGEIFLIDSSLEDFQWKITKEEKLIDGRKVYKAILIGEDIENKTHAWFCPEIPTSTGPIGYGNLPGLILELHLNNGFVFYANKIVVSSDKTKITVPSKGKKVLREEFDKIGEKTIENLKNG